MKREHVSCLVGLDAAALLLRPFHGIDRGDRPLVLGKEAGQLQLLAGGRGEFMDFGPHR